MLLPPMLHIVPLIKLGSYHRKMMKVLISLSYASSTIDVQNWSFLCVGLKEACNHLLLEPFFMPTYVLPFISICLSKRFRIHLASVCSQQSCFSLLSTIDIVLVKLSTRILCFQLLLHSSDILHQFAIHHDLYSLKFL